MDNKKLIKGVGWAATIIGFGLKLITDWVADKKLETEIGEKVAKEVAKKFEEQAK